MAIGKQGAYATVQASNVDFGEVALNAQKFQQAEEEMKAAKAKAKEAAKPKKEEDMKVDVPFMVVGTVTEAYLEIIPENVAKYNKYKKRQENGETLTSEELKDMSDSGNIAKTLASSAEEFNKLYPKIVELLPGSSTVSSELINSIQALQSGITNGYTQEGSNISFYLPEVDSNGNVVLDETTGKPKQLMTLDPVSGKEIPATVSVNDITSGRFLSKIYPKNDLNALSVNYAKDMGLYNETKENGRTTVTKIKLTKDNVLNLKESISTDLRSNNRKTLDVLSQISKLPAYKSKLSGLKYNKERTPSEEEYVIAEEYLLNQSASKIDNSYSKTEDEPRQDGGNGGPKDKNQPVGTVKIKNAFVYNKKGEIVSDLGKNASSEAIASGFETEYESFDKYIGRPGESGTEKTTISNAKVSMFFYDSSGNPTAMLEYQDVKGTGYTKEDVQEEADKLLKLFASKGEPLSRKDAIDKAEQELSLSSESKGEENKSFSQNLNPRQYRKLLDESVGTMVNGIRLDGTDETMRRATRATRPTTKPGVIKRTTTAKSR